jgi:hypothetical protein
MKEFFLGCYNTGRMRFIHKELEDMNFCHHEGNYRIRKTASFYGIDMNIYIDTSDGVNEDLQIYESCGRIKQIVNECKGKKFIMFKTSYSPIWSRKIIEYAEANNGKVLPFFVMGYYPEMYEELLPNLAEYRLKNLQTKKTIDIGFYSYLSEYTHPHYDKVDPTVMWIDKKHFGAGSGAVGGYYIINTRKNLYEKLINSRFNFSHKDKVDYKQFLKDSFSWKAGLNPPGCGEYTPRMLEHAMMGQCVVLRKTSYDNAISYHGYFPQIDFTDDNWQDDLQKIIDNYEYWGKKALEYYTTVYQPKKMVQYLIDEVEKYEKM